MDPPIPLSAEEQSVMEALQAAGVPSPHRFRPYLKALYDEEYREVEEFKRARREGLKSAGLKASLVDAVLSCQGGILQLEQLLSGDVDEGVLRYAAEFLPQQVLVANTRKSAKAVYNMALRLPHTATRMEVMNTKKVAIGGLLQTNVASRSTLLYAFDAETLTPLMLKIPHKPEHAKHEVDVWQDLNKSGPIPHLAQRLSLLPLQDEGEIVGASLGVLMQLYPATLQHVPVPMSDAGLLHVGKRISLALAEMHKRDWYHNDIKAPNIFLSHDGDVHLGDFGAARRSGGAADERTASHVPSGLHARGIDTTKPSAECDKVLLAVTLLERRGLLALKGGGGPSYTDVENAAASIEEIELASFVRSLLP